MEKYGFVYIWFDKKRKRFYIGSHWGSEEDGYICSSNWMRDAHKKRPEDFKRRVVARVSTTRNDLLIEEHRWLQMIDPEELGKKFYNLTNHLNGHWFASDEERVFTVKEKLKSAWVKRKERGWTHSEDSRRKISNAMTERGRHSGVYRTGPLSEETKTKLSIAHTGKKLSEEHRKKLAVAATGVPRAAKRWRCIYEDGRVIEAIGRNSFGIPIITIKRLAKSGKGSSKHGIIKVERI
jgi:hypothetical protein